MGGGLIVLLGIFAVLFGVSKLVEHKYVSVIWGGVIYAVAYTILLAVPMFMAKLLVNGVSDESLFDVSINWLSVALSAVVATIVLWLLDRYSETIAAWMVIFVVGYIVLAFVI